MTVKFNIQKIVERIYKDHKHELQWAHCDKGAIHIKKKLLFKMMKESYKLGNKIGRGRYE